MVDFRRALLLCLLAAASCDSGPTSDWPANGGSDNGEPPRNADAGVGLGLDASTRADSSAPVTDSCAADAGDAGDAGCEARDF